MFLYEKRFRTSRFYFTEGRRRSPFRTLDKLDIIRQHFLENHS
jgi:hypothetical protein